MANISNSTSTAAASSSALPDAAPAAAVSVGADAQAKVVADQAAAAKELGVRQVDQGWAWVNNIKFYIGQVVSKDLVKNGINNEAATRISAYHTSKEQGKPDLKLLDSVVELYFTNSGANSSVQAAEKLIDFYAQVKDKREVFLKLDTAKAKDLPNIYKDPKELFAVVAKFENIELWRKLRDAFETKIENKGCLYHDCGVNPQQRDLILEGAHMVRILQNIAPTKEGEFLASLKKIAEKLLGLLKQHPLYLYQAQSREAFYHLNMFLNPDAFLADLKKNNQDPRYYAFAQLLRNEEKWVAQDKKTDVLHESLNAKAYDEVIEYLSKHIDANAEIVPVALTKDQANFLVTMFSNASAEPRSEGEITDQQARTYLQKILKTQEALPKEQQNATVITILKDGVKKKISSLVDEQKLKNDAQKAVTVTVSEPSTSQATSSSASASSLTTAAQAPNFQPFAIQPSAIQLTVPPTAAAVAAQAGKPRPQGRIIGPGLVVNDQADVMAQSVPVYQGTNAAFDVKPLASQAPNLDQKLNMVKYVTQNEMLAYIKAISENQNPLPQALNFAAVEMLYNSTAKKLGSEAQAQVQPQAQPQGGKKGKKVQFGDEKQKQAQSIFHISSTVIQNHAKIFDDLGLKQHEKCQMPMRVVQKLLDAAAAMSQGDLSKFDTDMSDAKDLLEAYRKTNL